MGIEIVRERILSDARKEAGLIVKSAEAEAAKIIQGAESDISKELANSEAKARAEAEKISNQILSSAKLEARFRILQEKRKGIDGILESVRDELHSMKPLERASFIENTVAGLKIPGGKYELDCAERDLERIEKKRLDEISKRISADGEAVVIKKGNPIQISGGFILRSESADYDFSIESILRSKQGEIEAAIVKSLFGEAPKKQQE
ncbi:MAG: V-type ATP synthase subunit E [Candidatus Thermoplasmatota archaeon]|nr:V-type ATP synthase subunit E [Candidatus Thermoplasmatota archaeon]